MGRENTKAKLQQRRKVRQKGRARCEGHPDEGEVWNKLEQIARTVQGRGTNKRRNNASGAWEESWPHRGTKNAPVERKVLDPTRGKVGKQKKSFESISLCGNENWENRIQGDNIIRASPHCRKK